MLNESCVYGLLRFGLFLVYTRVSTKGRMAKTEREKVSIKDRQTEKEKTRCVSLVFSVQLTLEYSQAASVCNWYGLVTTKAIVYLTDFHLLILNFSPFSHMCVYENTNIYTYINAFLCVNVRRGGRISKSGKVSF